MPARMKVWMKRAKKLHHGDTRRDGPVTKHKGARNKLAAECTSADKDDSTEEIIVSGMCTACGRPVQKHVDAGNGFDSDCIWQIKEPAKVADFQKLPADPKDATSPPEAASHPEESAPPHAVSEDEIARLQAERDKLLRQYEAARLQQEIAGLRAALGTSVPDLASPSQELGATVGGPTASVSLPSPTTLPNIKHQAQIQAAMKGLSALADVLNNILSHSADGNNTLNTDQRSPSSSIAKKDQDPNSGEERRRDVRKTRTLQRLGNHTVREWLESRYVGNTVNDDQNDSTDSGVYKGPAVSPTSQFDGPDVNTNEGQGHRLSHFMRRRSRQNERVQYWNSKLSLNEKKRVVNSVQHWLEHHHAGETDTDERRHSYDSKGSLGGAMSNSSQFGGSMPDLNINYKVTRTGSMPALHIDHKVKHHLGLFRQASATIESTRKLGELGAIGEGVEERLLEDVSDEHIEAGNRQAAQLEETSKDIKKIKVDSQKKVFTPQTEKTPRTIEARKQTQDPLEVRGDLRAVPLDVQGDTTVPLEVQGDTTVLLEVQGDAIAPLKVLGDTTVLLEVHRDTKVRLNVQEDTIVHLEVHRDTTVHRKVQGDTTAHLQEIQPAWIDGQPKMKQTSSAMSGDGQNLNGRVKGTEEKLVEEKRNPLKGPGMDQKSGLGRKGTLKGWPSMMALPRAVDHGGESDSAKTKLQDVLAKKSSKTAKDVTVKTPDNTTSGVFDSFLGSFLNVVGGDQQEDKSPAEKYVSGGRPEGEDPGRSKDNAPEDSRVSSGLNSMLRSLGGGNQKEKPSLFKMVSFADSEDGGKSVVDTIKQPGESGEGGPTLWGFLGSKGDSDPALMSQISEKEKGEDGEGRSSLWGLLGGKSENNDPAMMSQISETKGENSEGKSSLWGLLGSKGDSDPATMSQISETKGENSEGGSSLWGLLGGKTSENNDPASMSQMSEKKGEDGEGGSSLWGLLGSKGGSDPAVMSQMSEKEKGENVKGASSLSSLLGSPEDEKKSADEEKARAVLSKWVRVKKDPAKMSQTSENMAKGEGSSSLPGLLGSPADEKTKADEEKARSVLGIWMGAKKDPAKMSQSSENKAKGKKVQEEPSFWDFLGFGGSDEPPAPSGEHEDRQRRAERAGSRLGGATTPSSTSLMT
ncbi:hypothetical protein Bbelb_058530 [Branchiostoma belcheri]|nr:hypothetical protein Bbelb_058530 [Branchiostoma belcheri]